MKIQFHEPSVERRSDFKTSSPRNPPRLKPSSTMNPSERPGNGRFHPPKAERNPSRPREQVTSESCPDSSCLGKCPRSAPLPAAYSKSHGIVRTNPRRTTIILKEEAANCRSKPDSQNEKFIAAYSIRFTKTLATGQETRTINQKPLRNA